MKRGEIYFANLDPGIGGETQKKRPVLIISNNANNNVATTVTIIPITSNIKKVYPFEVLLEGRKTGLPKDSKAQCHQIRTISRLRLSTPTPVGVVRNEMMIKINDALKLHLGII
ncbi:type II toxin-antitoxin system PemK/MazF family toxin [Legionella fairfieldensis]|uniref:type II toxin-antitoxin system PemK/MazF family toxin n=1 Tax=Legionella fairfieldensis TaxID=45064 RepID=UPI00048D1B50|nr:type II toxin-antitoxin system PemK/MazF family toxin [Legionella fairfieldensis]